MAKKEDEMLTRVMTKQMGHITISLLDGDLNPALTEGSNYTQTSNLAGYYYSKVNDYFDLSGYNQRDMTVFIRDVLLQNVGNYDFETMESDAYIKELRVVSKIPMTDDILDNLLNETYVPGSFQTTIGLDDVVTAQRLVYGQNNGSGYGQVIESQTWGTGTATAAHKLFVSRYFFFPRVLNSGGATNYKFSAPDLAFVVPMVAAKEPELEYFMRLSRSLEPVY